MGFEKLAQALEPGAENILKRIGSAIVKPTVDTAARAMEQGESTAFRYRNPGTKVYGDPAVTSKSRIEPVSPQPKTIEQAIQDYKTTFFSLFRPHPNVSKPVADVLGERMHKTQGAEHFANDVLRGVMEPLSRDRKMAIAQAGIMNDYLIHADEVAQAYESEAAKGMGVFGETLVRDKPLSTWVGNLGELTKAVQADPAVTEAMNRRVTAVGDIFTDAMNRGWIKQTRPLEQYTYIRQRNAIAEALAAEAGEDVTKRYASYMVKGPGKLPVQDMLRMDMDLIREYTAKAAEHDTWNAVMALPNINLTDKYQVGDIVARQHVAYTPGPGDFGYGALAPEQQAVNGFVKGLEQVLVPYKAGAKTKGTSDIKAKVGLDEIVKPGSVVIPRALVRTFEGMKTVPARPGIEQLVSKTTRAIARNFTVYNPANTRLNHADDLLFAMFGGIPGQPARPLGILREYPKAYRDSWKMVSGSKVLAKINGQTVDVSAMIASENVGESMQLNTINQLKLTDELARILPKKNQNPVEQIFEVLHRDRASVELAPRLAAAMDEFKRSGDIKEFGRIGREITLHFGAGGPEASRSMMVRVLNPFLQFQGLSTSRVFDLLRTPGSRVRGVAGLLSVPLTTYLWNNRNPEFQKVENSISSWERDQVHIIAPDMEDWSRPMLDQDGRPVVIRFKWWLPETVMKMAGLGNFVSRGARVVQGRDTVGEALASIPQNAGKTIAENFGMMPGLMSDLSQKETASGRPIGWGEKVMRVFPLSRPFMYGVEDARNHGLGAGLLRAGLETAGIQRANTMSRGDMPVDADKTILRAQIRQAEQLLRKAKTTTEHERALDHYQDLVKELTQLQQHGGQ